jgi:hypothetical protein
MEMDRQADLAAMEREVYRAYWSDGIVDLYLGLSLLFMGAMWVWLDGLVGIAGVIPAVFVTPMLIGHKRFVEARLGRVEWRPGRRGWERRNQLLLLGGGVAMLLLTLGVAAAGSTTGLLVAPALLAWLLAIFAVGLALLLDASRMLLYAAVLALGGLVVAWLEAEPGWPMLAGGATAMVVGTVLLRRFVERHPVIEQP